MLSESEQSRLRRLAQMARQNSYAPYSRIRVGAALLTAQGNCYTGVNIENASYGLTMCAERVAIFRAVAEEGAAMKIRAVAVAGEPGRPFPPCGACRQTILEFGPEALVLFEGKEGLVQMRLEELLPQGFQL